MFKLLACSDLHLNLNNGRSDFRPRTLVRELRERSGDFSSALGNSGAMLAVHCGDIFDLSRAGRRTSPNKDELAALREYNSGLNIPRFYLAGNSDAIRINQLTETTGLFLDELSNWSDLKITPGTEVIADHESGNFAFEIEGCLIVGLNSFRPVLDPEKEGENKDFLTEALMNFYGQSVIVFTHHNPFETSNAYGYDISPTQSWIIDYLKQCSENYDIRALVVCGHCHRWFQTSNMAQVQKLCLAPISPSQGFYGAIITVENKNFDVKQFRL